MTPAERGAIFRDYIERPTNHSGESKVSALLDRIQRVEAENERMNYALMYLGSVPCECQKNGARMFQVPDEPRAACLGCMATAVLEAGKPPKTRK